MNRWVVVVVLAVLAAAGLGARFLTGGSSEEVLAIGDKLAVGSDWTLEAQTVEPDRVLCLGDNPCPSLNRRYRLPTPLTRAEFTDLVARSGWQWPVSGGCRADPQRCPCRWCESLPQELRFSRPARAFSFYGTLTSRSSSVDPG